jgi:hypothetical protein
MRQFVRLVVALLVGAGVGLSVVLVVRLAFWSLSGQPAGSVGGLGPLTATALLDIVLCFFISRAFGRATRRRA